eukprot:COSAG01_NODE_4037_length_5412_cov_5.603614_3_plen_1060_part_01
MRGLGGEHTPIGADGTVDISPSSRFCITEAQIITALYLGIEKLKAAEDAAAEGAAQAAEAKESKERLTVQLQKLLEGSDVAAAALSVAIAEAERAEVDEQLLTQARTSEKKLMEKEDVVADLTRAVQSSEGTSRSLRELLKRAEDKGIAAELLEQAGALRDQKRAEEEEQAKVEKAERIANMTFIEIAGSAELTEERFQEKLAQHEHTLAVADTNGRTPLHYLCQNPLATSEMQCRVARAAPSALVHQDAQGNTPLTYLLCGDQIETQAAIFDPSAHSDGVRLSNSNTRAISAGENCYALANIGFSSGKAAWEFRLIDDANDDEFSCLGAATKPVRDSAHNSSSELMVVECYNGSLHWAKHPPAKSKICKIHEGDIVRVELDHLRGEISFKVNGEDHGVCFSNVTGEIFPAVCWYSNSGRVVELLSVERIGGAAKQDVDVATLKALIEINPAALGITDSLGRIPLQAAQELGINEETGAWLAKLSREAGFIWCGGVQVDAQTCPSPGGSVPVSRAMSSDGSKYDIHFMLHSTDGSTLDLQSSLQALSDSNTHFAEATRINGATFDSQDVQQCLVSGSRVAFLLQDGSVVRFTVRPMKKTEEKENSSLDADMKELESVDRQVAELEARLQYKQEQVDKAKEADYGYEDDDVAMLEMISGQDRDAIIEVLKTIDPNVSQGRLELASNVILGGVPLGEDGWWDGYEVGRYEYELGKEEKRVKPQLDTLIAQKEKLEAKVAAAGSDNSGIDAKPLVYFGAPEVWGAHSGGSKAPCKFKHMQASLSRLILLGENGVLYCWEWNSDVRGLHPRALELCPEQLSEGIVSVASSALRTTVLTTSGKMATWMDDICHSEDKRAAWAVDTALPTCFERFTCNTLEQQRRILRIAYLEKAQRERRARLQKMENYVKRLEGRVSPFGRRRNSDTKPQRQRDLVVDELEHRSMTFKGHESTRWVDIVVSDKGTVVVSSSGELFWWGLCPPQCKIEKKLDGPQHAASGFGATGGAPSFGGAPRRLGLPRPSEPPKPRADRGYSYRDAFSSGPSRTEDPVDRGWGSSRRASEQSS